MPGLIEGAAEGAGLGHRFLRHLERTRVHLHLIESTLTAGPDRDPVHDFDVVNAELARYAPDLAAKPQVVALNKMDVTETREAASAIQEAFEARGIRLYLVSAATGEGIPELLEVLWAALHAR
jgi:GTP-binding protein